VTNQGFTGHRHNNTGTYDLGLIYMNARYYLPEVGRFISPDAIVPDPANPQSHNRYSYVRNNPVNLIDPTGHRETDGCDILDCSRGGTIEPDVTFRGADGSYTLADPWLLERYPGDITAGELAFTAMGLATAGVAPSLAQGAVALWPAVVAAGVGGNPTNEVLAIRTGATTVYRYVENGITRYIGITDNFGRRAAEHLSQKNWNIEKIPGLDQLSRIDARAVEQVLIEHFRLENLANKINSISSSNPIYQEAIHRGTEILRLTGILGRGR
jgi:RHS repeat-associated protein